MAPILGARQLIDIAVPAGVDATEVFRFQMENGMTGDEAIRTAAAAIGQVNEELISRFGGLITITESVYARQRQGESTRSMTPKYAEGGINDPVRSAQVGHMLPREDYSDTLSWNHLYLRRADRELMRYDVALIAERWRNRVSYNIWNRALTTTENAVGSAGYDVPWAIGTGTNVNYIPPQYEGYIFTSAHTHFIFKDSASKTFADLFDDMMKELRHHGHTGTLSIYISTANLATVMGLTGFAKLTPAPIIFAPGGNTGSPVRYANGEIEGMPGELVGYYDGIWGRAEVRYHERVPDGYAFATKSYGVNDPRNGLAIRVEPGVGFGLRLKPQLDRSPERQLDYLLFEATFGVGVSDRTNGVAGYIANAAASYVNPSIT